MAAAGLALEVVADILHCLNSGQNPGLADSQGRRYRLAADAQRGRVDLLPEEPTSVAASPWFQIDGNSFI